ncbi:MAG: hypothetical protein KDA84_03090, partial [Planctomycetaceae bacterium]|nr:hypothetical protein [Planctomycetaceae bacterium]
MVDINGGRVAVGAPSDNGVGAVHLFDSTTGNLLRTIANPDTTDGAGDRFGAVVALDPTGTLLLVGAVHDDDGGGADSGAAYLFDAITGSLLRSFDNPNPDANDFFGTSVAIDGDYLLVGAPGGGGDDSGAAYLYNLTSGTPTTPVQTLLIPVADLINGDGEFGQGESISATGIVVGAPIADPSGVNDAGAAYFYTLNTTNDTVSAPTRLTSDDLDTGDDFGVVVAIDGTTIAVTSTLDDGPGDTVMDTGAVFTFDSSDINNTRVRIDNADINPDPFDNFGSWVDVSGDRLLVGANAEDVNANDNAGQAFLFDISGASPSLLRQFENPDPDTDDRFGNSVALDGL